MKNLTPQLERQMVDNAWETLLVEVGYLVWWIAWSQIWGKAEKSQFPQIMEKLEDLKFFQVRR
jgi:hypothetical protein